jgi:hypothetical protein
MSDPYLASLIDSLASMDDDTLLGKVARFSTAAPEEYRPEAIAAAFAEMKRRGLGPEDVHNAARRMTQDAVEDIYGRAVALAEDGRSARKIQSILQAGGIDDRLARELADRAADMPIDQRRRAARRNMITGAALCAVGLMLTIVGYLVAAQIGETRYVLFWGFVVAGIVQFLRGAAQSMR